MQWMKIKTNHWPSTSFCGTTAMAHLCCHILQPMRIPIDKWIISRFELWAKDQFCNRWYSIGHCKYGREQRGCLLPTEIDWIYVYMWCISDDIHSKYTWCIFQTISYIDVRQYAHFYYLFYLFCIEFVNKRANLFKRRKNPNRTIEVGYFNYNYASFAYRSQIYHWLRYAATFHSSQSPFSCIWRCRRLFFIFHVSFSVSMLFS